MDEIDGVIRQPGGVAGLLIIAEKPIPGSLCRSIEARVRQLGAQPHRGLAAGDLSLGPIGKGNADIVLALFGVRGNGLLIHGRNGNALAGLGDDRGALSVRANGEEDDVGLIAKGEAHLPGALVLAGQALVPDIALPVLIPVQPVYYQPGTAAIVFRRQQHRRRQGQSQPSYEVLHALSSRRMFFSVIRPVSAGNGKTGPAPALS